MTATALGPLDRVLSHLKQVRKSPDGWTARCPAHEDHTPSLSIAEGEDGRVLVTCFAGCDFAAIASAMGLERTDFFAERTVLPFRPSSRAPSPRASKRIVANYQYLDEHGALLYETIRYEPKGFAQRRPDGRGGWIWKLDDTRRVLYRLAETIEAVALDKRLYIAEGEKDCERIVSLGLTATTNARGANEWRSEYAETLARASVVVLEDNDSAGVERTRRVADSLAHHGCTVRALRLPGLPPKGDLSDWADAGGTAQELEALADAAPIWPDGEPLPGDDMVSDDDDADNASAEQNEPADQKPPRFRFITVAELAAIVPPPPLIAGMLFQGGFSAIVAPYDSYKSFCALDVDLHIAHGLDYHGRRVTPGFVAYQAAEGVAGLKKRVDAWCALNGVPEAGGIKFLPQSLKLNDARDLADFLAALRGLPDRPLKVTIDTFARSLRGNENNVEDTGLYVEAVDAIREQIGSHVQLIHHTGWEGTRSRGSSNIPASLDTEITLTRDGDRVTLTCSKQKDCEPFAPITLEAVTVAGSLAFRRFALTSPELSDKERVALRVVQRLGCIKAAEWQRETEANDGGKHRTFYNSKSRLESLGYVHANREGFAITDAGTLALGGTR